MRATEREDGPQRSSFLHPIVGEGLVSSICSGALPSYLIAAASRLAPTVCFLAIDFSFAERIMIARTVKVDDVAVAWVFEHWPTGKKRVACDGGKF
jgi:hypothetical protein